MDLRGYFDSLPDGRWGPLRGERPSVNGYSRRPRYAQQADMPAARNADGTLKAEPPRTPAEQARIDAAIAYIRSFEA